MNYELWTEHLLCIHTFALDRARWEWAHTVIILFLTLNNGLCALCRFCTANNNMTLWLQIQRRLKLKFLDCCLFSFSLSFSLLLQSETKPWGLQKDIWCSPRISSELRCIQMHEVKDFNNQMDRSHKADRTWDFLNKNMPKIRHDIATPVIFMNLVFGKSDPGPLCPVPSSTIANLIIWLMQFNWLAIETA